MHASISGLSSIRPYATCRFSSYDRSGGNRDSIVVEPGQTVVLAEVQGAGVLTHMWFTIASGDPLVRRNLVLRMYWDGCPHPSVEAPIGDFFGQGWGMRYPFSSLLLAAAPREGSALVCYFPMPFGTGARVEVENQGEARVDALYYYIDCERRPEMPPEEGRFHAWYNQELTKPESGLGDVENEFVRAELEPKNLSDADNYLFCECEGAGHFVGVNYFVNSASPLWYGEGDDMFCVDGEQYPYSAHGTGTEDYFNTAWGPDELFMHPFFGIARAPGRQNDDYRYGWYGRTHCYRFHLHDPVRFQRSLRASIEHGHANSHTLELATVAYWYQTMPHKPFPPLPTAQERKPRANLDILHTHRWRHTWREAMGGGKLWGDEPGP